MNAKGAERIRTFQMIKDAGFPIQSDHSLDDLIARETPLSSEDKNNRMAQTIIKDLKDLRPQYTQ